MVFVSWGKDTSFNVCCKKKKWTRLWSSGKWCHVVCYTNTNDSEELTTCIFWMEKQTSWQHIPEECKKKDIPVCAMKECSRNRGIAPLSLCHGTRWKWVVSSKSLLLYGLTKETHYQLNRLALPQSQFRHFGEENKLFLLPGMKPRTVLYQVLYPSTLQNLIPPTILTWLWVMPIYLRATIRVPVTSPIMYIKYKCMYCTSLGIGTGMIWSQLYTSCSPGTRSRLLLWPGSTWNGNSFLMLS